MIGAFVPGDRLGRYLLVRMVGGGGFAFVWQAKALGPHGFERDVAIKVMLPARASHKRFQEMLLAEARLVARIQHPNVAQIWEVGEDPRSLFIVMELVDGDSLEELRFRAEEHGKSLPMGAVIRVLADVCSGLHVAHELEQDGAPLGLVHRDISPQNILVSRHGNAKLIDFGIAKVKQGMAADTTTGFIKGKVSFMAPEQARSEEVDRRADVWAVAAVAYDLIEGKPPCEGRTDLGRLTALIAADPVPPMSDRVPTSLRNVIARALEKDRDRRYPTALALKDALEEALIEAELETAPSDVATLLGPYFDNRSIRSQQSNDEGHSAERAVSSTIDLRREEASRAVDRTEATELPLRRRAWPYAVTALGIMVTVPILWTVLRAPEPRVLDVSPVVSLPDPVPSARSAATAVASDRAPPDPTASTKPLVVSTASNVHRRSPPRPRSSAHRKPVDDNAIE